jgi:hypothetical protein
MIDRLSKQVISIPCYKTVTILDIAIMFISYIYYYFGLPESIVSNRGPQFVSYF